MHKNQTNLTPMTKLLQKDKLGRTRIPRWLLLPVFFFAFFIGANTVFAQKIIINEFYRGGNLTTTDEWIELLLIEDLTESELEGFFVGDATSSTEDKFSGYQFTDMQNIAASFPKGTIIVIGGDGAFTQDISYDPSSDDWSFSLNTSGSFLTSNGSNGDLAGTDVVYVDTNGTDGDVTLSADGYAINWDDTPGVFGGLANVTLAGVNNNTGVVFTSNLSGANTDVNFNTGVSLGSMSLGSPNGGDNTTYIESLQGVAAISISFASAADEANLDATEVNVTLSNETFTTVGDLGSTVVLTAPSGVTVESFTSTSTTEATIALAYDTAGNDFDVDFTTFDIQIDESVLTTTSTGTLDSDDDLTVTALDESYTVTASLTAFSTTEGTASASQNFTVEGTDLRDDVTITAPADFEVSSDDTNFASSVTLSPTDGTLSETTVYVRVAASASEGTPSGDISFLSAGAGSTVEGVSATVSSAGTPTATASFDLPASPDETSINTATIAIELTDETFADETFDITNFTIEGLGGATVSAASGSTDSVNVTIAYAAGDFDADSTISITIDADELTGTDPLTTNGLVVAALDETITGTGTLSAFSTLEGTASMAQSYTVEGADLQGDITVTPPAGIEIASTMDFSGTVGTNSSPLVLTQTDGEVAATTIYVRIAEDATEGTISGDITHVSTDADQVDVAVSATVGAPIDVVINEFRQSSSGSGDDVSNYIELFGPASQDLSGLSIVVLSGEFSPGEVNFVFDLSGSIDEDGLVLLRNATLSSVITQAVQEENDIVAEFDFFGSPNTYLLVSNLNDTTSVGDDYDSNNDGTLDGMPWDFLIDGVSVSDTDGTPDANYASLVLGSSTSNAPAGASRKVDGQPGFVELEFSSTSADTPGSKKLLSLYAENFETDPFNRVVGKWTQFSAAGDGTVWAYQIDDQRVRMNAFPEGCAGDDWLISPVINLTGASGLSVSMGTQSQFDGNDLRVYYATDYDAGTDPTTATLVEIDPVTDLSGRGPFEIAYSSDLGAASGSVQFFVHYESESSCAEWIVNNFSIQAESVTSPIVQFTSAAYNGREGVDATVELEVEVLVAPTTEQTIDVAFVSTGSTGATEDIESYTTQTLTFPANEVGTQSVTVTVTDDALEEGTEILIFQLENASSELVVGTQSQTALALGDDDFTITKISEIQGESHMSSFVDQDVKIQGIVTGIFDFGNGFYVQDIAPDDNPKTSEGIYIAFGDDVTVSVGDEVSIIGIVQEQEGDANEYTRTQLGGNPFVEVLSSGNDLPIPTLVGRGGRIAPTSFIDSDPSTFDPTKDGADFWESMENMLVKVQDPMAVSAVGFFDVYVVADNGADATGLSPRNTLVLSKNDFNPEKIEVALGFNDLLGSRPTGAVEGDVPGTKYSDITGIITYDRGQFEVTPTEDFTIVSEPTLNPVTTMLQGDENKLSVATYNVLNLDPNNDAEDDDVGNGRFGTLAKHIITNLNSPDIIGLQEIQDNTGSEGPDGVISADETLQLLVDSIAAAGGPTYGFIDNRFLLGEATSGGDPNGNIRTAFLFNTARVDTVTIPNDTVAVRTISSQEDGDAFEGGRLPLVAAFSFNDTIITIVNNHFSSKGGSAPVYGMEQPFVGRQEDVDVNGSLDERQRQSRAVQEYVLKYTNDTDGAPIVVMGDLNEFDFVSPVRELEVNAGLVNLTKELPVNERYTFIFQGNAQSLDHILVSGNLLLNAETQIVHLNPEFGEDDEAGSDHDPIVATLDLENLIALPQGGQSELTFRILEDSDDAEESLSSDGLAFREQGDMDLFSSDLELGLEEAQTPQLTGLRYNGFNVPQGAVIASAFVQFTVDATGFNTDPADFYILIEDNTNPGTYTSDSANISSRKYLPDTVRWNVPEGSWATPGERGLDQRSADVSSLIQQIVNRPDWVEGNAIALVFGGTGTREAESFATSDAAPTLTVNFIPAVSNVVQIASQNDDAEEYLAGGTFRDEGAMDLASSDIELGSEEGVNPQVTALRFTNLNIPRFARVSSAHVKFTVDAVDKNVDPTELYIRVENSVKTAQYIDEDFNITSRNYLEDSIKWSIGEGTWDEVGESGSDQSTPNLASLLQKLVNDPNWVAGDNAVSFIFRGTGVREAESFNDAENAAKLLFNFVETAPGTAIITAQSDDAEESLSSDGLPFRSEGDMDLGSSDLELGLEEAATPQLTALRYTNLPFEPGQTIQRATVRFTVDATNFNIDPAKFYILVEDTENSETYTSDSANISSRTYLADTIFWEIPEGSWATVGESGPDQTSADISSLIQQIVNKEGWARGNAISIVFGGISGAREAESFSTPDAAPVLEFEILEGALPGVDVVEVIPDVSTSVGKPFKLDLSLFFEDKDSPIKYFAQGLAGTELPDFIALDNDSGIIEGISEKSLYLPVEVLATSLGDTASQVFNLIVTPKAQSLLKQVSSVKLGSFDEGAAEISAFDPSTDLLFVTNAEINAVEVLDMSDPTAPARVDTIDVSGDVNSVAVRAGKLAIAIANDDAQEDGTIDVYTTADFVDGTPSVTTYTVGALPDMVTFADDNTLVVANEGEPNDDYTIDPEGSVSIIDLTNADLVAAVSTADFTAFNGTEDALRAQGVRIFGPGATVAQDLEPEYITVEDGKAYVTLQENNALAIVDIATATVDDVIGLGFKDHSLPGNGIDTNNDRDTPILIDSQLPIFGMYQPDAIASVKVGDATYLLTANEGDARDYDAFSEETEIGDIDLDPNSFGRDIDKVEALADGLTVSAVEADTTDEGKYKEIFAYGSRSFSIWNAATGALVWDSGDDFEQITASLFPKNFNASNSNRTFKNRSDNKGPEPEAVTVGQVGNAIYAFVGLERIGGIMVYDITDPTNPEFIQYVNNRNFLIDEEDPSHGDLGPEGLVFVSAEDSPNGSSLLIVSNEVSGTVTTYEVGESVAIPTTFTLEVLHLADQEAPILAIQDAPRASAIMNALESQDLGNDGIPDNTIRLSSGDAFIPGLFFDASVDAFGSGGIADFQIQNELEIDAISFGNHEFDFGPAFVADLISGNADGVFNLEGTDLEDAVYEGANFPYLSTNLDFSTEESMAPLFVPGGQLPVARSISSSTVLNVNGELIGVVGATTPTIVSIADPGDLGVAPSPFDASPSSGQINALADIIQAEVDMLLSKNEGLNKVILLSHMQSIGIERSLAQRLTDVDVIIGGGSNTRFLDNTDRLRPGDLTAGGVYPEFFQNPEQDTVALVNTDGQYKYIGRLVLDFDEDGKIIPASYDQEVSGAYATDTTGVKDLKAEGLVDPEIQAIASAIEEVVIEQQSNVFGVANVFLNGERTFSNKIGEPNAATLTDGVRSQETNLGNLTADANIAAAKEADPSVVISLKNGGGIRASIGTISIPPGSTGETIREPNEPVVSSEGETVKPEGGISEPDIVNALSFNNALSLLTLTKSEIFDLLNHAVSDIGGGRFGQVSGIRYSFDPDLPEERRIVNAVIEDADGNLIEQIVSDGDIVGDPTATYRVVTLNFLADPNFSPEDGSYIGGGDGYPFPNLNTDENRGELGDPEVIARVNRVDLAGETETFTGVATFAADGTEQDALAEYLAANFSTTPFDAEDVGSSLDERIQNLAFREDGIGRLNTAPVVDTPIGDQEVETGASIPVEVANTFSDPEGDELTISVESGSTTIATASINGTTITITGVADGTATITVTASDGELTVSDEFEVTVTTANQAPVVENTIAAQSVIAGQSLTVNASGTFSDPDGDALTLSAESSSTANATVAIDGTDVIVTGVAVGSATITVTASDGELSVTTTFEVTVEAANTAPTIEAIANQSVDEGATVTVTVSVSDAEGDDLTVSAESSSVSNATVAVSGTTITITGVASGSATIEVTVTDGELSSTTSFTVTVNEVVTGINDLLSGLSIYPNPATSEVNILHESLNISKVKVYSTSGKVVISEELNTSKLDVSQLKPGIYMIQVIDENAGVSVMTKFVKR